MSGPRKILDEIHRRSLWQVLGVYLAGGWAVFTVVLDISETLLLPAWVAQYALALLLIGLPIVLVTSYVQQGVSTRPAAGQSGLRALFTWRNALTGGVLAFAGLGFVTMLRVMLPTPGVSTLAGGDAPRLAVFPATVLGPTDAVLHEGIVDLLSGKLGVLDQLEIVDPGSVIKAAGMSSPEDRVDSERAAGIATDLGWSLFVLPVVTATADQVRVRASLFESSAPQAPLTVIEAEGDRGDVFAPIDRVATELVLAHFGRASARLVRSAYRVTDSPDALGSFLRGEQAMRRSRHDVALEAFQRAFEEDDQFALAYLRAAVVSALMETDGMFDHLAGSAPNALPAARALADVLDGRDRAFLDAFEAFREGDGDRAEAGFGEMLLERPGDVEARFFLGQTLLRLNPIRGRHAIEALPVFMEVLHADPDFTCPI